MTIVAGAILIVALLFVVVLGSLVFFFIKKDKADEGQKTFVYGTDGDNDSDDFINQIKNGL